MTDTRDRPMCACEGTVHLVCRPGDWTRPPRPAAHSTREPEYDCGCHGTQHLVCGPRFTALAGAVRGNGNSATRLAAARAAGQRELLGDDDA